MSGRYAAGLMAWLLQRVTAIYLALFAIYLFIHFIFFTPTNHQEFVEWVSDPRITVLLLLFVPVVLSHAWVGIRDVIIDYVRILNIRVALLMFFAFMFVSSGFLAIMAIFDAGIQGGARF